MNTARLFLSCILIAAFLVASCEIVSFDDNNTPEIPVPSLDENISFYIWEGYPSPNNEPVEPVMQLRMATEEIYPCINYEIVSSTNIEGSEIRVRVDSVHISPLCLTAIGPATAVHNFEVSPGEYDLVFLNGNIDARFPVTISREVISVGDIQSSVPDSLPQFTPAFTNYYRYPEKSFALVGGTNTNNKYLYENFRDSLDNNPALTSFTFPDDGVIPYPDSGSGHWVDYPASFYYYREESDFHDVGEFLIRYSENNIIAGEGVGFSVTNWKNERYLSWLHDQEQ